jgi:hypothetical protein
MLFYAPHEKYAAELLGQMYSAIRNFDNYEGDGYHQKIDRWVLISKKDVMLPNLPF